MNKAWLGAFWSLFFVSLLSGCFVGNMVKLSPDTYIVRVEDHGGIFSFSRGKLKSEAIQRANNFAASQRKVAIPIAIESHPMGVWADWAAVEYQFRIVSEDDPEARTSITPQADVVIESAIKISADIKRKEKTQVIPVKVIGYSPKTTDKNIKLDSQRAMIDAKIKAIERAGVKIESSTLVNNFELLFDFVESKSKGVLLPGFEFVEFGYDENGVYKVLLIGNVQSLK